jgi:eukaryotic-like serine/threonine-protein kinase
VELRESEAPPSRDRDWPRLETLLDRLLELPEDQIPDALDRLGPADLPLRSRLEAALAAARGRGGPLSGGNAGERFALLLRSEGGRDSVTGGEVPSGTQLGRWRVTGELGRGGMGAVYAAERADGEYTQQAALKLLHRGIDDAEGRARFLRERQILADLDHPGIARLLDGGVTPDGRPFLVLERVDGEPITSWCDGRRTGVDARIRLFLSVLGAVEYAHRNLVVHRDLKPSNILVSHAGEAKLLDFGVAKLLDRDESGDLTHTLVAAPLTPQYAAPEQVTGGRITTATDVYALGLVLFELLTGERPYRLTGSSALELEQQIVAGETSAPSRVARRAPAAAAFRATTPEKLGRRLGGDLDAIVLRALAKEPSRRYASAADLRRDLESHLAGRPVVAQPDSTLYRLRKFARRHRLGVASGLALLLALVAGLAALGYALVESRARLAAAERAQAIQAFLVGLFSEAEPTRTRGHEVTARQLLDRGYERIDRELAGRPRVQADLFTTLAYLYGTLGVFDRGDTAIARALELRRQLGESSGPGLALSVLTEGELRYHEDRYRDAVPVLERALAELRSLGGHDAEVSRALSGLASAHSALGELDAAERIDREALDLDRRRFGISSSEVATDLVNLALTLDKAGRDEEALPYARESLELRRRTQPSDAPELAASLHAVGAIENELGRYDEAERDLRAAVATQSRILGGDHPDTLDAENSLRQSLEDQGRREESLDLARKIFETGRRVLAPDDPQLAAYANNLAVSAYRFGSWPDAERGFRAALEAWNNAYGESHFSVATGHHNLGMVLLAERRFDEAEAELRKGLGLRRELRGDRSPDVAQSLRGLGMLELARGRLSAARDDLDRAVALAREVYEPRHPRLAEALATRADLELAERRPADAVRDLEEALAIRVEKLGADNPLTAETRAALARAQRAAAPPGGT